MRVAVTGASGFIGRFLTTALSADHDVRAVARQGGEARVAGTSVEAVADITDRAALARAFTGMDAIIHLAGLAHRLGATAAELEAEYHRVNVGGTEAVVRAAAVAGARRVIVASSVKAIGESSREPWTEAMEPVPSDAYGRSKLAAERAALTLGLAVGVEVVVARFPLVYGPGAPANVRRLVRLVASGVPLPFGAIRNRRSMLYLGNLAEAMRCLLRTPGIGGCTFFLSDGVDLSTPELVRLIAAALGRPARLVPVPVWMLRAIGRVGDLLSRVRPFPLGSAEVERLAGSLTVSTAALQAATGYLPRFTPAAAWAETAAWYGKAGR